MSLSWQCAIHSVVVIRSHFGWWLVRPSGSSARFPMKASGSGRFVARCPLVYQRLSVLGHRVIDQGAVKSGEDLTVSASGVPLQTMVGEPGEHPLSRNPCCFQINKGFHMFT